MKPNTENLEKVTPETIGKVKSVVQKTYGNNDMEAGDKPQEEKRVFILHNATALNGYKLKSLDGEIGRVKEFYFDDRHWAVRYLVADTGSWLQERQVLISPYSLAGVDTIAQHITIDLTRKQIEQSPSLNSDKPVSRQFEDSFHGYYGYPEYWVGSYMWGTYPDIVRDREKWNAFTKDDKAWDPNLRSTQEVSGHHIQAADGEIGHVEDFIIDEKTWAIRYLIIDTKNWWAGKKILVSPQWIDHINWDESKVFIKLPCEVIRQSPEYSETSLLTREYETRLYLHYNRRGYWAEKSVPRENCREYSSQEERGNI